ncbi:hypothetical protein [Anaeromyxobacter dehalogenans]|uniref:Uncharacterized protein n=1 Tax=Anaeromyxobacter dehalogenans (strain 2CP-C) TaxID=290397 RepID=Q2IIG7_ANADE|nr:hypothetical protein [Anaeromyxobacter dehalogenans]ABC81446.1 hypothetical protein Adeh_1673 [Anaeromyxobacter dehalogenans 2CP-C]
MEGRPPFEDDEVPAGEPPDDALEDAGLEPDAAAGPGVRGLIPDTVKKALLAGVGALFMTEEGARRLARDWKLPKDVIAFIGQQAQGAKGEVLRVFSDEVRRFLESEAVRREFLKALSTTAIEVKAEIRLKPSVEGGTPRPEVKAEVKARRAGAPRGRRAKKDRT